MAGRMVVEKIALKTIQRYHHTTLNSFGEHETLLEAVSNRPGLFGPNPVSLLSVMARRRSVRLSDLEEALLNDRSLIRACAFRGSLFLLSSIDYPVYFRALYSLVTNSAMDRLLKLGVTESHLNRLALAAQEIDFQLPQTQEQLMLDLYPGKKKIPSLDVQRLILRKLCDLGILVRTYAKGWKGNEFLYALIKNWIPEVQLTTENPESARTETVRRYLRCYGPASAEDVSWWTGLSAAQVQRSISHLRREAIRIPVEGFKEELLALREFIENMPAQKDKTSEIRFFPPWDPFVFGWQNRKRMVDKEFQPYVYDLAGNATGVIVDDGKAIGIWQFRDSQINVFEFHVFHPYVARRKEVFHLAEVHATSIANLSGAESVHIFERPLLAPLAEREPGSFLWPLGKDLPFASRDERLFESPVERRTSNTFRHKYLDSENVIPVSDVASFGVRQRAIG